MQDRRFTWVDPAVFKPSSRPATPRSNQPGTQFSLPLYPTINAAGQVAFPAVLQSGAAYSDSLWVGVPGAIAMVARAGDITGTGGLTYGDFNLDIDTYRTRAIVPHRRGRFHRRPQRQPGS